MLIQHGSNGILLGVDLEHRCLRPNVVQTNQSATRCGDEGGSVVIVTRTNAVDRPRALVSLGDLLRLDIHT